MSERCQSKRNSDDIPFEIQARELVRGIPFLGEVVASAERVNVIELNFLKAHSEIKTITDLIEFFKTSKSLFEHNGAGIAAEKRERFVEELIQFKLKVNLLPRKLISQNSLKAYMIGTFLPLSILEINPMDDQHRIFNPIEVAIALGLRQSEDKKSTQERWATASAVDRVERRRSDWYEGLVNEHNLFSRTLVHTRTTA